MKKDDIEIEENVEDFLNSTVPAANIDRVSDVDMLSVLRDSLRTCNACSIGFIQRKSKEQCPICHSTDISKTV